MESIKYILTTVKNDLAADMPALLADANLRNFTVYEVGESRNAKDIGIFVYKDTYSFSLTEERLTIIIQAQLKGIGTIEEAAEYEDVILDYFREYNPRKIGATSLDQIESDTWPASQGQGAIVFIYLSYSENKDGCDE